MSSRKVMRFLVSVSRLLARRCSIPTHAEGPGSDVEIAMVDYVPATDELACARRQISELERASEAMPDKPASQFAA